LLIRIHLTVGTVKSVLLQLPEVPEIAHGTYSPGSRNGDVAATGIQALHLVDQGGSVTEWYSVLDSGAEGPGFKSQPRRCRVIVLGKLFTPIVPLFTKQRNW